MASKYPEAEKLAQASRERIVLDAFLEWCEDQRIELGKWESGTLNDNFEPLVEKPRDIVFRYLGIDPKKLEAERKALLDMQRSANKEEGEE